MNPLASRAIARMEDDLRTLEIAANSLRASLNELKAGQEDPRP